MNNGVTILADDVGGRTTELTLHEPQIVNGLQTSQVIFEYFRDMKPAPVADKRRIVIRIVKSSEEEMRDNIIQATNSQTKLPSQFLRTSDPLQRDIEVIFKTAGLHYDRRKNSWRKAEIGMDQVVGMSELAQSAASVVLGEADHARARPSRYFKFDSEYERVFNTVHHPIETYIVCARLKKKVEDFVKTSIVDSDERTDLMFYVLMAVGHPLYLRSIPAFKDVDVAEISQNALKKALRLVRYIYKARGGDDKTAKGKEMVRELKKELSIKPARRAIA